jgi:hypothetical protein
MVWPDVVSFCHGQNNTFSPLLADWASGAAMLIDEVLDYHVAKAWVNTAYSAVIAEAIAQ